MSRKKSLAIALSIPSPRNVLRQTFWTSRGILDSTRLDFLTFLMQTLRNARGETENSEIVRTGGNTRTKDRYFCLFR